LGEGESLTEYRHTKAVRLLNGMIQSWVTEGVHLWKYKEATLFLEKDVKSYDLGNSVGNATESYVETTLSADSASGTNTVVVTSSDGMSSGDFIGIELDDGSAQWTTINGAPVGTTVTLTDNLTGDASSGVQVKAYTTKITKPSQITQARFEDSSTNEIECIKYNRTDYFKLSNKSTTGASTQIYFNPLNEVTRIYVWPVSDTTFKKLNFTYYPDFEIFVSALNEPDFPKEWYRCLVWNLAEELAVTEGYGDSNPIYAAIQRKAQELFSKMHAYDAEFGILSISAEDTTGQVSNVY